MNKALTKEELLAKHGSPKKFGDKSMIRLVDVMGDDSAIVQAARVSYGAGTKTTSGDRALLRYLMRHSHTSPIEMCSIKFHISIPMHVARQLVRHRTGKINEESTRYSFVENKFELVSTEGLRLQSTDNKQGSSGFLAERDYEEAEELGLIFNSSIGQSYAAYQLLIDAGVAREQARNVLPLATMTSMYWQMDLHNLLHFLRLRLDPHAQLEIRELSHAIAEIIKDWVPYAWEAFEDYKLNSMSFSLAELQRLVSCGFLKLPEAEADLGEITDKLSKRELVELFNKLKKVGDSLGG